MDENKRFLLIFFILIILGTLFSIVVLYFANQKEEVANNSINTFDECVTAGGTIIATSPVKCDIDGNSYNQENPVSTPEYYGSSTKGACNIDSDCTVMGCNSEICGSGTDEPAVSVCVAPTQPLPKDLGYSCRCVQQKCDWKK